jgi:hypothetical protein
MIGIGLVLSAPLLLGFGSAGIVGGSVAAATQSTIANVAAGSLFASMQSLGAIGVTSQVAAVGGAVSTLGVV